MSRDLFPHFPGVSRGTRAMISRNMNQIIGSAGEPLSEFVVCWTPRGAVVGGTAYAIKAARSLDIPVFNVAIDRDYINLTILMTDIKKGLS
jgi:hypothetical protein